MKLLETLEPGALVEAVISLGALAATLLVAFRKLSAGVMKRLDQITERNGGSSLRDAIDRVEAIAREALEAIDRLRVDVEGLEGSIQGALELDSGGNFWTDANGSCLWVSEEWSRLTGLERDHALGEGWIDGIHEEDRARVFAEWNVACHSRRAVFDLEYRTARAIRIRGRSARVTNRAGETIFYLGVLTPVPDAS